MDKSPPSREEDAVPLPDGGGEDQALGEVRTAAPTVAHLSVGRGGVIREALVSGSEGVYHVKQKVSRWTNQPVMEVVAATGDDGVLDSGDGEADARLGEGSHLATVVPANHLNRPLRTFFFFNEISIKGQSYPLTGGSGPWRSRGGSRRRP